MRCDDIVYTWRFLRTRPHYKCMTRVLAMINLSVRLSVTLCYRVETVVALYNVYISSYFSHHLVYMVAGHQLHGSESALYGISSTET